MDVEIGVAFLTTEQILHQFLTRVDHEQCLQLDHTPPATTLNRGRLSTYELYLHITIKSLR